MGFEEIAHTADWSVRVWAGDLPGLFREAGLALNALAGIVIAPEPRLKRSFESAETDPESLLVSFLSELVYLQEQENLAFDTFEVQFEAHRLKVEMEGAPIASVDKAIKAVTYHNLKIEKTSLGFEVIVVFDV
jgi:SHS2 domain-containing protein